MQQPSYEHLKELHKEFPEGVIVFAGATGVHPNPKLYKYHWWVFTRDSPEEGPKFLTKKYRLNFARYKRRIEEIRQQHGVAMVYNQKSYRIGPSSIWDQDKIRAKNPSANFTTDYENDPDPTTECKHK